MRKFLALVLVLCLHLPTYADVTIARSDRIENESPGYCLWCSIEMLGRAHGVKDVAGLAQYYKDWRFSEWSPHLNSYIRVPWRWGATMLDGDHQLQSLGIKHRLMMHATVEDVRALCDQDIGCVVSMRWWKPVPEGETASYHAIAIVGMDDEYVRYVDPNHPLELFRGPIKGWFDVYWTHQLLTVEGGE